MLGTNSSVLIGSRSLGRIWSPTASTMVVIATKGRRRIVSPTDACFCFFVPLRRFMSATNGDATTTTTTTTMTTTTFLSSTARRRPATWKFPDMMASPPYQSQSYWKLPFLLDRVVHQHIDNYIHHHDKDTTGESISESSSSSSSSRIFITEEEEEGSIESTETTQPPSRTLMKTYTYRDVFVMALKLSKYLVEKQRPQQSTSTLSSSSSSSPFIAHLNVPSHQYVACQWSCWLLGKASLPLATSHPTPELQYILRDSKPEWILTSLKEPNHHQLVEAVHKLKMEDRLVVLEDVFEEMEEIEYDDDSSNRDDVDVFTMLDELSDKLQATHDPFDDDDDPPALLLYTSGTTGLPKGVVHTHSSLFHQVTDLVNSWQLSSDDKFLHLLPLHHTHGIVNTLCCPVYVGAQIQFVRKFDAVKLWNDWAAQGSNDNNNIDRPPNVLMAVPTIYAKLLEAASTIQKTDPSIVPNAVNYTLRPMRLQVSGSAALPASIKQQWFKLTGHTLLERYGMTEIGMALSLPYHHRCDDDDDDGIGNCVDLPPTQRRHLGYVGLPLPSVKARLIDPDDSSSVLLEASNGYNSYDDPTYQLVSGKLQIQGPTLLKEYWNRQDAMEEAFGVASSGDNEDNDDINKRWFDTGDMAEYNPTLDSFRILGRMSVDILKVGGYKISALEIECVILEHPDIAEVVVVGVDDDDDADDDEEHDDQNMYGQRIGVIARLKDPSAKLSLEELQEWLGDNRLAKYKLPRLLKIVDDIPKNAMGKYNKKSLVKIFAATRRPHGL